MQRLPKAYIDRPGERGAALVVLAIAAVLGFMLLVVIIWAAGQYGAAGSRATGDADDPGTGTEETAPAGDGTGETVDAGDGGGGDTVAPVPGCIIFARHPRVTPRFIEKVVQIARQLRTDPNFLMATMKIESDFDHTVRNKMGGSATGLIQIIDSTAHRLGLPNASVLAGMSAEQQLDYVRRYYVMSGGGNGRMREVDDAYMVVFYPKAAGKAHEYVIARKTMACTAAARRTNAYCGNEPYDLNRDGVITKHEAGAKIRRVYNQEMSRCRR